MPFENLKKFESESYCLVVIIVHGQLSQRSGSSTTFRCHHNPQSIVIMHWHYPSSGSTISCHFDHGPPPLSTISCHLDTGSVNTITISWGWGSRWGDDDSSEDWRRLGWRWVMCITEWRLTAEERTRDLSFTGAAWLAGRDCSRIWLTI